MADRLRAAVKGAAERLLCRTLAAPLRRRHAADTIILAYHNIVPEGETAVGDLSLHLPQREFARQLDLLTRTHDIVSLAPSLDDMTGQRRPRAVITFDDACQGAVSAGVAELARRSLPATIFVAPAFVGGRSFWWDAVEGPGAGPGEDVRQYALTSLQGSDARVRAWAAESGLRLRDTPWHQTAATETQLRDLPQDLLTLGSHSWSHPNLTTLAAPELNDELTRPIAWLRDRFPNTIPWLAYPYGLNSPAVAAATQNAGYVGALRITGGWHRPRAADTHPFGLPRHNIPAGLSLHGFELRISGVLHS